MGRRPKPPRDPIYCSVDGCEQLAKQLTLKLCNAHYGRYRRNGDPLGGRPSPGIVRPVVLVHGTVRGYTDMGCRCEQCREANRQAGSASKRKRLSRPIPDAIHGTHNGYVNYNCRCEPCVDSGRHYAALLRQKQAD